MFKQPDFSPESPSCSRAAFPQPKYWLDRRIGSMSELENF